MSTPQKEKEDHKSEITDSDVSTKHMEEVSREPSLYGKCLKRSEWNSLLPRDTLTFKFDFEFRRMVGKGVSTANLRSTKQEGNRFYCSKAHQSV